MLWGKVRPQREKTERKETEQQFVSLLTEIVPTSAIALNIRLLGLRSAVFTAALASLTKK